MEQVARLLVESVTSATLSMYRYLTSFILELELQFPNQLGNKKNRTERKMQTKHPSKKSQSEHNFLHSPTVPGVPVLYTHRYTMGQGNSKPTNKTGKNVVKLVRPTDLIMHSFSVAPWQFNSHFYFSPSPENRYCLQNRCTFP